MSAHTNRLKWLSNLLHIYIRHKGQQEAIDILFLHFGNSLLYEISAESN